MPDCNHNIDPLKLVREGTSQEQRPFLALDPAYAPVDERDPAQGMVFAQAYAQFLRYYDGSNVAVDDWKRFFGSDVSVQLAIAAVQDVEDYKSNLKAFFDFLNDRHNSASADLTQNLGYLFACAGTMAHQLDALHEALPAGVPLKGALQNLIQSQLAEGFRRLIYYFTAAQNETLVTDVAPDLRILGAQVIPFGTVITAGLSNNWITDNSSDWNTFAGNAGIDTVTYGLPVDLFGFNQDDFTPINRLATHNLFTSVFDRFLKVYARVVSDAKQSLQTTFTNWDSHEPHYALFLAFLRLKEFARTEMNTLTGRHLDLYYQEILQLRPKPAEPGHVHLLLELAKQTVNGHLLDKETLFKAGKDEQGHEAFFKNDRDFVANQAKVVALKTVYRHKIEPKAVIKPSIIKPQTQALILSPAQSLQFTLLHPNSANVSLAQEPIAAYASSLQVTADQRGRIFASPVANSDDGAGAELTSVDKSWHPFYNQIYKNNILQEIRMPLAEVGFAVASNYLFLAGGTRTITLEFMISKHTAGVNQNKKSEVICLLTSEKGWIEKSAAEFQIIPGSKLRLKIELTGSDKAITPYDPKVHGYGFDINLPILLLKIKHNTATPYIYQFFQNAVVTNVDLMVDVKGLKTLAVSNDFGPVDTSKPFQPFGALPENGSSITIGSKEIFQKKCTLANLNVQWQNTGTPYKPANQINVLNSALQSGKWSAPADGVKWSNSVFSFLTEANSASTNEPDFSETEPYNIDARHGYVRFSLNADFGQQAYQTDLRDYLIAKALKISPLPTDPLSPPIVPVIASITADYTASQAIKLDSANQVDFANRQARFFHLAPFGQAEQHPALNPDGVTWLFPQFQHRSGTVNVENEAEFYIGIKGLRAPQNLALLIQVADGTADPLAQKPVEHLHWNYLRNNEWAPFTLDAVEDTTGQFTRSGIVTLAVPRDATDHNTLLPGGMHWIRVAVSEKSEAVCRLFSVAAQALRATFTDQENDPAFQSKILPAATISKLDVPDSAIKKVEQPFPGFGGRGQEASDAFYTRVSERLRHKERAITLWDYERLVLEAFPQIYKVKCLNHTKYEPTENSTGVYRELAPGHVTLVTIPNQQIQNLRDPLRPYTSLGVLLEIEQFLRQRLSCFVRLHVKNPQFEPVRVAFLVRFYEGYDETFYTKRLREEITRFLSPWAFPGGGSPSFGGKIYKSTLINFIEERPYVDFVTNFQLFHHIIDFDGLDRRHTDRNEVEASTAVSILVSVPADISLPKETHEITVITALETEVSNDQCACEP